jgi:uncharacterized protein involved in exopolysaccharide biosynthesis
MVWHSRKMLETAVEYGSPSAQLALNQRKEIAELKQFLARAQADAEIAERQVRDLTLQNDRLKARIAALESGGKP